jgi:hypothetical protein
LRSATAMITPVTSPDHETDKRAYLCLTRCWGLGGDLRQIYPEQRTLL